MGILDSLFGKDQMIQPENAIGGLLKYLYNNWASPTQVAQAPGAGLTNSPVQNSPNSSIFPRPALTRAPLRAPGTNPLTGAASIPPLGSPAPSAVNNLNKMLPNPFLNQANLEMNSQIAKNQMQNQANANKAMQSQPKMQDYIFDLNKAVDDNPAPTYSSKDLSTLEDLVAQTKLNDYRPAKEIGQPSKSVFLPEDKTDLLNNLKGMAEKTFPDNPNMQQVSLSQAILESGLMGKNPSRLASETNNLFGIKSSRKFPGTGGTVDYDTTEYVDGQPVKFNLPFSTNYTPQDSFNQYKDLMTGSERYQPVVNSKTPQQAFEALQGSGYATDPNYGAKLAKIHSQYVSPLYQS